jgi:hypothetical protein
MLGRALFWIPWLCPHRMTMQPSTRHQWSPNGLSMRTMSTICHGHLSPDLNPIAEVHKGGGPLALTTNISCCTVVAKRLEDEIYIFTKSAASVFMMAFAYTHNVMKSDQMNCKKLQSPSLPCKGTESPQNISIAFQHCHKRTSWHHVSDSLVNTGVSVDEDKVGDHFVMLIEFQ